MGKNFDENRYECFLGFNTKQYWIIDSKKDVLIDPPIDILDKAKEIELEAEKSGKEYSKEEAQHYIETLCNVEEPPKWLFDKGHWYDIDTDV